MQLPRWLRTLLGRLGPAPRRQTIPPSVVQWSRAAPDAPWRRQTTGQHVRLAPLGGFALVDGDSDRV